MPTRETALDCKSTGVDFSHLLATVTASGYFGCSGMFRLSPNLGTHNPKVADSNPGRATIVFKIELDGGRISAASSGFWPERPLPVRILEESVPQAGVKGPPIESRTCCAHNG